MAGRPERRRRIEILLGCLTVVPLLAIGAVLAREAVVRYPVNHVGFDIRGTWAVCLIAPLVALRWRLRPWMVALIVVVSGLLALEVFVFDHFNVLVQYERWCDRGMPAAWQR
jgi:hypothetical protein